MLVEDDNNLREIYEARLLAEGYEIVSAKDGEEALALAVKEKPDLIISDVMMPKISGFDMLDILRSTAETKNTKVIMMTALSQAEDKTRADKLGADRYLVKSQVTLEDVAKVARDVLAGEDSTTDPASLAAAPTPTTVAPSEPPATPEPTATPTPVVEPPAPEPAVTSDNAAVPAPDPVTPEPPAATEPAPPTPTPIAVNEPSEEPAPADPVSAPEPPTEEASAAPEPAPAAEPAAPQPAPSPSAISDDLTQTTASEEAAIESQINEIFTDSSMPTADGSEAPAPAQETPPVPETSTTETVDVAEEPAPTPEPTSEPAPEAPAEAPAASPISSDQPPSKRVIQPINDVAAAPNLNDLLKKEEAMDAVKPPTATTVLSPTPPPAPGQDVTPPPAGTQPGMGVAPGDIAL